MKALVPSSGRGAFKALSALAHDWSTALEAGTLPAVGARLAGAAGALAAALDGTTHARTLRKLKLTAVTIDRADRERHVALAQALRDALASLALEEPPRAPSDTGVPVANHEAPVAGSTRRALEPSTPTAPSRLSAAEARALPPAPASAAHERLCDADLTSLPGVGPAVAARLVAAGIRDIGDLLLLRPRRYEDRRERTRIIDLAPGQFAVVHGIISRAWSGFGGGGRRFSLEVTDESGALGCSFFRVNVGFANRTWTPGSRVVLAGQVSEYRGRPQMAHPTVDVLAADSDAGDPDAALRPLYPEVEGVGDRVLRRLIGVALDRHGDSLPDALPDALRSRLRLPTIADALRRVHRPPHDAVPSDFVQFRDPALRRFIFDELLTLQLALAVRRQTTSRRPAEPIGDRKSVV